MITKIDISNFKAIKTLSLAPASLNLFMGLNGMGKSTVIQALLLLRQSGKTGLSKLLLNGDLVNIGRGRDVLYNFADRESIAFGVDFLNQDTKAKSSVKVSYLYQSQSDVLNVIKEGDIVGNIYDEPLFSDEFVFLNADRLAPSAAYDMSYDKVMNNRSIGIHGELAVHFLSLYGDKINVARDLCLSSAASDKLMDQVQEWMQVISPGVRIETKELSQIDKVMISYGFQTDSISTNAFRPTNVGFGISYILPVLVACLSGVHRLIIIENPEAHLHPKGQSKMGELIARCAQNGAQLFVETHSDHIVNGLRVAVKENIVKPSSVAINYFTKKISNGENYVDNTPIKIGINGELSEYPPDFLDEWENQLLKLY